MIEEYMKEYNVGQDFLKAVKGHKVVCFEITVRGKNFILKKGYKKADFSEVVKSMLRYKALASEISGTIWCKKGVWFDRARKEMEFAEDEVEYVYWWEKYSCPQIPEHLSGFGCVVFMCFLWLLRLILRNESE